MRSCTFFGHRDCSIGIREQLYQAVKSQIVDWNTTDFYVGNHGRFGSIVQSVLQQLSIEYPSIRCTVVLAYMPKEEKERSLPEIYPEGLECVPPRYAITHRNLWMLDNSDVVIAYVARNWGGAAQCVKMAQRRGKIIINLYQTKNIPQNETEG